MSTPTNTSSPAGTTTLAERRARRSASSSRSRTIESEIEQRRLPHTAAAALGALPAPLPFLRPGAGNGEPLPRLLCGTGCAAPQADHAPLEMARLLFGSEAKRGTFGPEVQPVPGLALSYDCIVPVPASSRARGYNVPERMARPMARAVGVPMEPKALVRVRAARRQEGLSLDERPGAGGGQARPPCGRCHHHRRNSRRVCTGSAGRRCPEHLCRGLGHRGVRRPPTALRADP